MLKLALAEDYLPANQKLVSWINRQKDYQLIYAVENGYRLLQQLYTQKELPDIILMDINMPVIDGIAATHFIKVHFPLIKIIALSVYVMEEMVSHTIISGADGYVGKGMTELVLTGAIAKVVAGNTYIDERLELNHSTTASILNKQKKFWERKAESIFGLTQREITFVMLAATIVTYEQIAGLMSIDIKTVHTYFDHIAKKLKIINRQGLTYYALQNGLARMADFSIAC